MKDGRIAFCVGLCVVVGLVAACAVAVVGLLIGYVRTSGAVMGQLATLGYSKAEGRVVQSAVKFVPDRGPGNDSSVPDIHYTYVVQGRQYRSHQFNYLRRSEVSSDNWSAQGEIAARPVGARVVVYYDPRDPADAVLVRGIWGPDWVSMAFWLVLTGIVFTPMLKLAWWWFRRSESRDGGSKLPLSAPASGGAGIRDARGKRHSNRRARRM